MEKAAGHGFAGIPAGQRRSPVRPAALEQGLITPDQFIDLNQKIGGHDIDCELRSRSATKATWRRSATPTGRARSTRPTT